MYANPTLKPEDRRIAVRVTVDEVSNDLKSIYFEDTRRKLCSEARQTATFPPQKIAETDNDENGMTIESERQHLSHKEATRATFMRYTDHSTKTMRLRLLLMIYTTVASAFLIDKGSRRCSSSISSFPPSTRSFAFSPSLLSPLFASYLDEVRVVDKMPEPLPKDLKNSYYLLRHGQSTANVASIISSSRSLAYSEKHGLTPTGYEQGLQAAIQLLDMVEESAKPEEQIVLVSSPFARARGTAQACMDGLDELKSRTKEMNVEISSDIVLNDLLVERYFGRLDGEAIYTYAYDWPLDKFNVTHTAFDVESVAAVCTRLREVVLDLESQFEKCHIVLVSHADVLQIAQLYAAEAENVGTFSSYRFKNGEVRRMAIGTDKNLPEPEHLEAPQRGTQM